MRVAKVKLNREQMKLLLNEKTITINLPAGCEQMEISAPLADTAERLLRESDLRLEEKKCAFIDALFNGRGM